MAASAAAALLDELMGRDRNVAPGERKRETRWDDPEVCKHFLCGFCPTELFTNTRADLGVCDKLHDEALKKGYEKSSRIGRMGYEEEFVRHLQSLLADVERRIKRGHARLALNNTQGVHTMLNQQPVGNAGQEQIEILTSRINELVEEAEQLGCEGKVEEAQGVMKLCEQLREEREQLTANRRAGLDEENIKRMEVCQTCGALLVSGDAQQRIDEHMSGKQHVGYARIRDFIENHKKDGRKSDKASPEPEEAQIAAEREEREKLREKEREERKKEEKSKEKERSRDRDERRSRRRRSKSRSRHRSRSRDKSRRSRSRDRKKSRDRDRDRDRDRRSRHKSRSRSRSRRSSRERSRRSRSRDRKSRRHRDEDENRKSSERNGDGRNETEEEKPVNPPEPMSEPPVDESEYTAGDTN